VKKLRQRLESSLDDNEIGVLTTELKATVDQIIADPSSFLNVIKQRPHLLELYSSCTADVENAGHDFGGELPQTDKKALIAFLATL